jgi:DNA repair exonuclease SbcCD ATPase subunit
MSVRLVELSSLPGRSVLPPGEKRKSLRFTSEYVWTQIDDSLTVPQARDAIRDLDNQLGNQINEKRDLKQQIHSLKKQIIDLLKNRKDLKEAYIKLKEEKLHSDELNLELMEGTKELAQQMQDLNEEKLQMKIDLDSRLMEAEDRIDNLQRRFEEERLSNEKLQLTLEQQKNDYENLLHERADEYNAKTEALSLKHQGEIQRQEEIVADLNEKLKDCEAKLARSEEANKVQQERIKGTKRLRPAPTITCLYS